MNKLVYFLLVISLLPAKTKAQEHGWISGSFLNKSHFYFNDQKLGIDAPLDRFASNNYLWVQFNKGPVSAGIQMESYMPPMIGYPYQLEGTKISHRFLRFRKGFVDITAGNFYEQFGSGLSFRSYEDRSLGINNSIDGIRVKLTPVKGLGIKGIYGKQRKYFDMSDAYIRGIDGYLNLSQLFEWDNNLKFGTGVISKFEPYYGPDDSFPSTVNAFNGRIITDISGFSANIELVIKSEDPNFLNMFEETMGSALSTNVSYSRKGFGSMLAVRFLNNMDFRIDRSSIDSYSAINYLPSNTRQHVYLLSNIYPYPVQSEAEASFQADIFYTFPRNTTIGGNYGTKLRFNYSHIRDLKTGSNNSFKTISFGDEFYYSDINLEVNRRWTKRFKSILLIQAINYNKGEIELTGEGIVETIIIATDFRYYLNDRFSIKAELQHLWTQQDHGNWIATLLELSYSPNWSVYFSDMTDYEYISQVHYINSGITYSNQYFRISAGFGRNRAGYICSGGVCQYVPAYTGFNLGLSSSF